MYLIKIKDGYILRNICGCNIVMPTGEFIKEFNGVLILNDTAAIIYKYLQQWKSVEETVDMIVSKYDIDAQKALEDVKKAIETLIEAAVVDECLLDEQN